MYDPHNQTANDLFDHFPKDLKMKFKQFHSANPHVYDLFIKYTRLAKAAGYDRYSAYAIMHRIRWEMNMQTQGSAFKIDDSFTPIIARLAEYWNPDLKDFFEFRKTWPSC